MNPFDNIGAHCYPANPEALPTTPRRIEICFWTQVKRLGVLVGLLLGPNVVLVWGYQAGTDLRLLRESGVSTTGKVEYLTKTHGRRGGPVYHVSYLYKVDDQTHLKQTTVTRQDFDSLREGGPIAVTYLPADPQVNCLGAPGHHLNKQIETTLIIAGLVAVAFGIGLTCLEFAVRREIHLATHGLGTVGRIVDSGMKTWRNRTTWWARYQFSSPVNEHAGSWHWVPRFIWEHIPRGQNVTILYDPQNPARHLPLYAFKYVRVRAVAVPAPPPLDPAFADHVDKAAIHHGPSDGITVHGGSSSGYSGQA